MAVNLSVKNVPERLANALRARAEGNHRSLQGELMSILERAIAQQVVEPVAAHPIKSAQPVATSVGNKLTIEELAARATRLFPQGTPNSVEFLRAMRDGRYGETWVHTGSHNEPV